MICENVAYQWLQSVQQVYEQWKADNTSKSAAMIVNFTNTGFIHAKIVSYQGKLRPFCGLNWLPNSAQLLG